VAGALREDGRPLTAGFPMRADPAIERFANQSRTGANMTITGSCHCGKSAFRIEGEIPEKLTRCTCSFCSKRGALWAYYQPAQFQLTSLATDDATYR
jgi:hypothetical protein